MISALIRVILGDPSADELAMFSAGILYSTLVAGVFVLFVYVVGRR